LDGPLQEMKRRAKSLTLVDELNGVAVAAADPLLKPINMLRQVLATLQGNFQRMASAKYRKHG
jgi:hypothetical protein